VVTPNFDNGDTTWGSNRNTYLLSVLVIYSSDSSLAMAKKSRSVKNRVQNVRVLDEYAGSDSAYVDRVISQLQNSHSFTTLLCTETFNLSTASSSGTDRLAISTTASVVGSDDFQSMAQQFATFRVRCVRYDVYDVNASVPVTSGFSTYHDSTEPNSVRPALTLAAVLDSPDSQVVPPGMGKISLFWRAKGTLENEFQSLVSGEYLDYGGLRGVLSSQTLSTLKYQIVFKAVVDFRGRR
jgi:hypothetical protein